MDRVTEWSGGHGAVIAHDVNYIDLLARYEDTGLTPEDVLRLRDKLAEITGYARDLLKYGCCCVTCGHYVGNGDMTPVNEDHPCVQCRDAHQNWMPKKSLEEDLQGWND